MKNHLVKRDRPVQKINKKCKNNRIKLFHLLQFITLVNLPQHFFFYVLRPVSGFIINSQNILTDNAQSNKLYTPEKEYGYGEGGKPLRNIRAGDFNIHSVNTVKQRNQNNPESECCQ